MSKDKMVGIAVFLLRVVAGIIFIQNGGLKLFGWFGGMPAGYEATGIILVAGVLEFVGGIAILLGLFTRPVAFVLSGQMAVAYFIGHVATSGHFFVPLMNQGQPAVLLCFIFLFLAAYGPGYWSADEMWAHRNQNNPI